MGLGFCVPVYTCLLNFLLDVKFVENNFTVPAVESPGIAKATRSTGSREGYGRRRSRACGPVFPGKPYND